MTKTPVLHIDFETGSTADLKKIGVARYAEDPTTRIICVAYSTPWNEATPDHIMVDYVSPGATWHPHPKLKEWVLNQKPVAAWNALFEWYIMSWAGLGVSLRVLDDTMARAAYWGLPLSLDMASNALPELGIVKDKQGHALMKRMSRPRKVNPDGSLEWWDDVDLQKRSDLMNYCAQDVATEMAIARALPPLPDRERRIWMMDALANNTGVPLDVVLAQRIKALAQSETKRLDAELAEATGGLVTACTQSVALAKWAFDQGLGEASGGLAKDRLPKMIEKADALGLFNVSSALALRQEAAKSSVAKVDAMLNYAGGLDYRMRGLTQYYGAFRTGRWAGRGPQVQNYPRPEVDDQEGLVNAIKSGMDARGLELFFGVKPMTALSSALRGCLWVPEGEGWFAALDFSQIEARVLAWLAGSEKILSAYRMGKDLYILAASGIYKVPEHEIGKDDFRRQIGKVAVLALGYQGGVGAFQTMAKVYGLEITDPEADKIKTDWREANPEIVSYWYDIQNAALDAVKNPGQVYEVTRNGVTVKFSMWRGHLLVGLPSGRHLVYRDAQIAPGQYGDVVSYMGVDQYTRQWTRIETYGGKLVENITQAVARDVLADAMLRVDGAKVAGVSLLGSIHDEILLWIAGADESEGAAKFLWAQNTMQEVPLWAEGLPLKAAGYRGRRFKK